MSPLTLSSTLGALRKAGSVFGVIFCRQDEVLFSDAPFVHDRISEMATTLDDIAFYFQKENRHADQLAFGYDGGNLVVVVDELFRIIVLHSTPDEVDFIAKAARAFLKDYQMSLFSQNLREGQTPDEAEKGMLRNEIPHQTPEEVIREESMRPVTQRVTLKAEQAVDPTEPINPTPAIPQTEPITPMPAAAATRAATTESGYADEPVQPVAMSAPAYEAAPAERPAAPSPEPPMEYTVSPGSKPSQEEPEREEGSAEEDSETVMLSREHTAPILATQQPANTLPPPRMPKRREG